MPSYEDCLLPGSLLFADDAFSKTDLGDKGVSRLVLIGRFPHVPTSEPVFCQVL